VTAERPSAADIPILRIDHLDLGFVPRPWAFAEDRRADIDAHFKSLQSGSDIWNGRVLLMHHHEIDDAALRGSYFETDFASFLAWRDWDFPDRSIRNCFAQAAILTSDNAFLMGVMGGHTANAGRIYFPGGTPDPSDIVDGRVDLESSMRRELIEETGLDPEEFEIESGWYAALALPRIGLIKLLRSRQSAAALCERALAHLAQEKTPELSGIRFARGACDLDPMMPAYVAAFLKHFWRRGAV
jgi:8-oxo-dGTP pyrophosphatase MutT (NUDIX family)